MLVLLREEQRVILNVFCPTSNIDVMASYVLNNAFCMGRNKNNFELQVS